MGVSHSTRSLCSIVIPSLLAILLFSLSVSSIHASFFTLSNDDGSRDAWYSTTKGRHLSVSFSIPFLERYRIIIVEFFVNEPGVFFKFHVYDGTTHVYESETWLESGLDPGQWVQAIVTEEIVVQGTISGSDAMWVSVEYETDNKPGIGLDTTMYDIYKNWDPDRWLRLYSHSFEGKPGTYPPVRVFGDLMIRVQVEKLDIQAKKEVVQPSGSGMGASFAVIAIGAGAAAVAGGLVVAISQPRPEVYALDGHYYCRKHRTPLWSVEGRLWCPVERRFLKP